MNPLRKVTSWKRKNRFGEWKHNHIEDGHSEYDKPKLQCVNPDKHEWEKELGYLENTIFKPKEQ